MSEQQALPLPSTRVRLIESLEEQQQEAPPRKRRTLITVTDPQEEIDSLCKQINEKPAAPKEGDTLAVFAGIPFTPWVKLQPQSCPPVSGWWEMKEESKPDYDCAMVWFDADNHMITMKHRAFDYLSMTIETLYFSCSGAVVWRGLAEDPTTKTFSNDEKMAACKRVGLL